VKASLGEALGVLLTPSEVRLQCRAQGGAFAGKREDYFQDPVSPSGILGTDLKQAVVGKRLDDGLELRAAEPDVDVDSDVGKIDRKRHSGRKLDELAREGGVGVDGGEGGRWITNLLSEEVEARPNPLVG